MTSLNTQHSQEIAAFALRITLGSILLAHGLLKLLIFTPSGTVAYFTSLGLPEIFAYTTILIEVCAGSLLIIGALTRISALISLPILIGASWVHIGNGWVFSNQGGGWEFPIVLVIISIIVALQGAGKFALRP